MNTEELGFPCAITFYSILGKSDKVVLKNFFTTNNKYILKSIIKKLALVKMYSYGYTCGKFQRMEQDESYICTNKLTSIYRAGFALLLSNFALNTLLRTKFRTIQKMTAYSMVFIFVEIQRKGLETILDKYFQFIGFDGIYNNPTHF